MESKIFKPSISETKRKAPSNISIQRFGTHFFHDPPVKAFLPSDIKFDDPTVAYSLANPIRYKMFDFNKLVSNLDVKSFLQDNTILSCNCPGSAFINKDHRLGTCGSLKIIN